MSRIRMMAAAATLAAVALFAAPTAAFAHDDIDLGNSTPTENQIFETMPTEFVLNYTANIGPTAEVYVIDANNADWTSGTPVVDGSSVTIPMRTDLPTGGYLVVWRIVSSDGHPNSGAIPFGVGAGSTPLPVPAEGSTLGVPTPAPEKGIAVEPTSEPGSAETQSTGTESEAPTAAPSESASETPVAAASDDDSALRTTLIGVGGALAAVILIVIISTLVRRSRRTVSAPASDAAAAETDGGSER